MAPGMKSTLMAMAAAALGLGTLAGCSNSSSDPEAAPAAHETSGGEAKGGEGSCKASEGSCSGKGHDEAKAGEGSCGEGSCS